MSVIKRLGNLAKGTLKSFGDDDGAPLTDPERRAAEDELRRLEEEARHLSGGATAPEPSTPPAAAPASPLEAKRKAVAQAYIAGVLSVEERDAKLAEIDTEEEALAQGALPKPRKRTL